jgi:Ca2+-binding RTX toxin-like protein
VLFIFFCFRKERVMSRVFSFFVIISMLLGNLPLTTFEAAATALALDEDAATIAGGLKDFGIQLDHKYIGNFSEFASLIPLTDLSPGGVNGLGLNTLFGQVFSTLPDTYGDLDALDAALDGLDRDIGGVAVRIDSVTHSSAGSQTSLSFTLTATRTVTTNLVYSGDAVNLAGGQAAVDLSASTALTFVLDNSLSDPLQKFYLQSSPQPTLALSTSANAAVPSFASQLGFLDINIDGNLLFDIDLDVAFNDPDGGGISIYDWTNTALADLVTLSYGADAQDDVNASFNLTANLPGTPLTGSLTIVDPSLANGFEPIVTPSLGDLADFTNISADEALSGMAQFTAGLLGLQQAGDLKLPFMKEYMGDVFAFAEPVVNFIRQQGDADIVCGTQNTVPPRGEIKDLAAGSQIYCQAYALEATRTVTWTLKGTPDTVLSGDIYTPTVSMNPTSNVTFTLLAAGTPVVNVGFEYASDPEGTNHLVVPRFTSAQNLLPKLLELGGFDSGQTSLAYSSENKSLSYHLVKTFDPPPLAQGQLDFGDQLKEVTNMGGLTSTSQFSASIDPKEIKLDVTFGILLSDEITDTDQRFYLAVQPAAPEFQADADISATVDLKGTLGFLEVAVQGKKEENTADTSTAFAIGRANNSPMLSVDITAPGVTVGATTIPNALLVKDLLDDIPAYVNPTCNVKMSAGLMAKASLGGGAAEVSGGIAVDWPNAFDASCKPNLDSLDITPKTEFSTNLKSFDISPSLYGKYTAAVGPGEVISDTLTDITKDFNSYPAERKIVGSTLKNLNDGSRCVITSITNTTATCQSGLEGGATNSWHTDDKYEISGDPLAMLAAILDNLDSLATQLDSLTGVGNFYETDIPLTGLSPKELVSQFTDLRNAIDDIRTGTPDAIITCGLTDTNPPVGDPKDAPVNTPVYCQASTPISTTVSTVNWTMNAAAPVVNTTGPSALNTVQKNPSANATFTVEAAGGVDPVNGFQVNVEFVDEKGSHFASLPALNPPQSLQKLEKVIESKLGIPANALQFEIGDVDVPGSSPGVQDLKILLGYGICTHDTTANVSIDDCQTSDKIVKRPKIPINLDLSKISIPGLVGFDTGPGDTSIELEFLARARFDMAVSLESSPKIAVLGSSGVDLQAGVAANNLKFAASVGPLSVDIGTGAVITGAYDGIPTSTLILTDTQASFVAAGIMQDDIVHNVDDGSSCTIASLTETEITCSGDLAGGTRNYWQTGDQYRIGGNGVSAVGAQFSLKHTGATPDSAYTFTNFFSDLDPQFGGRDNTSIPECTGKQICTSLSMMIALGSTTKYYLGDLKLTGTDITDPASFDIQGGDRLVTSLGNLDLDWVLLLKALPELVKYAEDTLDGASSNLSVPLIGNALDGGAEVARRLREDVLEPFNTYVLPILETLPTLPTNVGELTSTIATAMQGALPSDLLIGNVTVTAYCDGSKCSDPSASITNITDLRVTFMIGQNAGYDFPIDIGVPGLPLRAGGTFHSTANWQFLVDFGLSKDEGPYIVAQDPSDTALHPDQPELVLSAGITIGDASSGTQAECNLNDPNGQSEFDNAYTSADLGNDPYSFSNTRCLIGVVGFLYASLRDGTGPQDQDVNGQSYLTLSVGLDLLSEDASGRINFQNLVSGSAGINFVLSAETNLNLRFRTGVRDETVPGFPSLVGAFHLDWKRSVVIGTNPQDEDDPNRSLDISFDNLYLDVGAFVNQFLAPITSEVKRISSPFMPVIETVRAPLPVLSDLSRMTGGGDISLMSLLEASTGFDPTLINRIIDFIVFANSIDTSGGTVWIPLGPVIDGLSSGSFSLDGAAVRKGPVTPGKETSLITNLNSLTSQQIKTSMTTSSSKVSETTFTKGGLSFPFLQQPSSVFGLLLGKDIVLVHFDAGTVKGTAGVSYTFRFAIGPVPMSVTLAGSATLEGRFAMGYDTYGLRQVLNGGIPGALLDGIYIDDLDANGNDVPEVRLVGRISARAAVDLVIVSAGVGGGIELTVNLDLDDRPDPDGKLRIDEIVSKLSNPWCLFVVSGKLEAFLEAFVKIDFFFFSKTWTFELARITLLEFSAACDPPNPVLATVDYNMAGDGTKDLLLYMGSQARRNARGVEVKTEEEKFVLHQLSVTTVATGTKVSVAAFGVYQVYTVPFGGIVYADGDSKNDTISLEPGADPDGKPITFTLSAMIYGGDGADEIRTGFGQDTIDGGPGNDKINAGGGNDTVHGRGGNDAIDGFIGDDWLYGDEDNDSINGGAGSDHIYGGIGDDTVAGGPGSNSLDKGPGPYPDTGDFIFGEAGDDSLQGGWGDDWIFGDDNLGADPTLNPDPGPLCEMDGATVGRDLVNGDEGDDKLFGGAGEDEMKGGAGNDWVCGNGGNDFLDGDDADPGILNGHDRVYGGSQDDILYGRKGNDLLFGGAGYDDLFGGAGKDVLKGEGDNDILIGDEGQVADHGKLSEHDASVHQVSLDQAAGLVQLTSLSAVGTIDCDNPGTQDGNADCLYGGGQNDFLFSEGGYDKLFGEGGDDYMEGGNGVDYMEGNGDNDTMRGGNDTDTMYGNAGIDTMYGDSGDDWMYGGSQNDTMRGGTGDDRMWGNENTDTMYGDAGQDDMIGGSSCTPDDGLCDYNFEDDLDYMYGNTGQDVMVGDNGRISRPGGSDPANGAILRNVVVANLDSSNLTLSGPDEMSGGEEDDRLYGGNEGDTMHGDQGDDYLEGNPGEDWMYGDLGQDDLIGGTSQAGVSDTLDHIFGGSDGADLTDDYDVIVGDNATITRPRDDSGLWQTNTFNMAIQRSIWFYDIGVVGNPADASTSGGDWLYGENNDDVMYGQGGDDHMSGGSGDDYMEGNAGVDYINGDAGNDDLLGGTGPVNNDDPHTGTPGRLDSGDYITGTLGFDFMAGDNAVIARTLMAGQWTPNIYNGGIRHDRIYLVDLDSVDAASVSGGDTMWGGDDDDVMYGQAGDDQMHGGSGQDYMEGNAGSDHLWGDAGQDDMIGGTGLINNDLPEGVDGRLDGEDWLYGESDDQEGLQDGDGGDVMLGDNGLIQRPLGVDEHWQTNKFNDSILRVVKLLDVETLDNPVDASVYGPDHMWGNDNDDLMWGQGGMDEMHGGAGDDYMEGNTASDTMFGDANDDDMLGGTGPTTSNDPSTALPGRIDSSTRNRYVPLDQGTANVPLGDEMHGGGGADVMLGDNGLIQRPVVGEGNNAGEWIIQAYQVFTDTDGGAAPRHIALDTSQRVDRTVTMIDTTPGLTSGSDLMYGDAGDDDLYGQFDDTADSSVGDELWGGDGEDAMLGDNGVIHDWVVSDPTQTIAPNEPFIDDVIFVFNTLFRETTLQEIASGGNDRMLGGLGADWMHGGAGYDLMNGNAGDDHLFGDDGPDAMWGGLHHDHLWGGNGDDYLDVLPRPETIIIKNKKQTILPPDPKEWFAIASTENFENVDYIYGGWDQDAMQADVADEGPVSGDRLLDWVGTYNVYYLCPGVYGEYVVTRDLSPAMQTFLQQLGMGDGAVLPDIEGTSGFDEVAIVYTSDVGANSHPVHPDNPGHFTCSVTTTSLILNDGLISDLIYLPLLMDIP